MPQPRYAIDTTVTSEGSRAEIERELKKYGATSFGYGWQGTTAIIVFEFENRRMKFTLTMPTDSDVRPTRSNQRARGSTNAALEKETRRRWRSLALSIKAKLVTVGDHISTVEEEFMGHIILPNGMTVTEWLHPQLDEAYQSNRMPPLMIMPPAPDKK